MVPSDAVAGGLGDSLVLPPGFRFSPTHEELVVYHLKRKICRKPLIMDIIAEIDIYKWEPEELPGLTILKTGDRQSFFFCPRKRNGARSSRGTRHGYWKVTGKVRKIKYNSRPVGWRKTLVYYKGRTPNHERTNWVMHEYTMDEEELKRCQNVKDCYALCMVFKKSGRGPKNGEQYGAPFREEDWADDDSPDIDNPVMLDIPHKKVDEVDSNPDSRVDAQLQSDDNEDFIKRILDLPQTNENAFTPSQILSEEAHSFLLEPTSREIIVPEPVCLLNASGQQCNLQNSFDFTQSTISQLPSHEVAEVTSTPNVYEHKPHATVEEVSDIMREEDFLEMDDLPVPEPSQTAVAHLHGNFQLEEFDGLSVFDLFQDAPMFLPDNQPTTLQPYVCSPEQWMASQFDYQFESNLIGERQDSILQYQQGFVPVNNQLYFDPATQINSQYPHDASQDDQCQLNGQHQINAQHHLNDQYQINGQHQIDSQHQMNFHLHIENQHQINNQLYLHDATQIGKQLWTHDEGRNVFPSAEFSHNSLSEPFSVEEDFPTMDDPLGPVPSQTEVDHLHDKFSLDGLREFDLLPDATVFLPDMELINQPASSQPRVSLTNVGENVSNLIMSCK